MGSKLGLFRNLNDIPARGTFRVVILTSPNSTTRPRHLSMFLSTSSTTCSHLDAFYKWNPLFVLICPTTRPRPPVLRCPSLHTGMILSQYLASFAALASFSLAYQMKDTRDYNFVGSSRPLNHQTLTEISERQLRLRRGMANSKLWWQ